jgi:hypothetical protein
MLGVSKFQKATKNITVREAILCDLKENLFMAQNHMNQQENQGHFELQFF